MYLKRLELSGFKSFARTTVLEFPSRITAIVGPNGSGKSNIKEAIQWVLGEQSMKSLRGKKGEDLIWNGSAAAPRMGKASVVLLFDNRMGVAPVEFEEVAIGRKIFRDGVNEYSMNDSPVRLKDVVELMARIGLGETKHNIIGQGEVDRILMASGRERRAMLEEALGLNVYHLKKSEAERKLESTENNVQQVQNLLHEIAPHLKFLRTQAHKAEAREGIEQEFVQLQKIYFAKEHAGIEKEKSELHARREPIEEKKKELEGKIARLKKQIAEADAMARTSGEKNGEKELIGLEDRRRELEHEIGRLEGKIEAVENRGEKPSLRSVDTQYIHDELESFISEIKAILEEEDRIEVVRSHLLALVEDLEKLLHDMERGSIPEKQQSSAAVFIEDLQRSLQKLQDERMQIEKDIASRRAAFYSIEQGFHAAQLKIREYESMVRSLQEEERTCALAHERHSFDLERIKARETALAQEVREAGMTAGMLKEASFDGYAEESVETLHKKIERLRLKLEEIGGIDQSVMKEFEETEARHVFLNKEVEDLEKASRSLKELIKELDQHVREDFKKGFATIKEEFHNYFRIIFGGGKGTLMLSAEESAAFRAGDEGSEFEEKKIEQGIDITVDLPHKRIRGLAMLSGGERALTSVALLFAIAAVNPPPFLILDETDAALDEANSQRYGAILKELAKKTQLILITHNRETMKSAGVLYGVTMGDDGVSRLLSLKLEEAEEYTG